MCELLGISAKRSFSATELLDSFYQHSVAHPHGWGLAVFFRDGVSVEKEPERVVDSRYLRSRGVQRPVRPHPLRHGGAH